MKYQLLSQWPQSLNVDIIAIGPQFIPQNYTKAPLAPAACHFPSSSGCRNVCSELGDWFLVVVERTQWESELNSQLLIQGRDFFVSILRFQATWPEALSWVSREAVCA